MCLRHYIKLIWESPTTEDKNLHCHLRSFHLKVESNGRWLQFSRQRPSFSAHRAALMTKTNLIFPTFSSRFLAELRRPLTPPNGASYSYRKERETHDLIYSRLSWPAALLAGAYARRRPWRRSRATWRPYSCRHAALVYRVLLSRYWTSMLIMIHWHMSKQGICWPVSRDHIAG